MYLTREEEAIFDGEFGRAAQKSMEIIVALGEIYDADRLIEVKSAQIAGVSYHNIGDAGLEFLEVLAKDGKARVLATTNPAGMDLKNWRKQDIEDSFARKQLRIMNAFKKMRITTSCTCTPYIAGNLPKFREHVAWSESSAVAYANSVIGARTNREGGPSALASALTGKTANYGLHLQENRNAEVAVNVKMQLRGTSDFGALGWCIGMEIKNRIPYITGIKSASMEELKSLSASIATYGGTAMFHIDGITPERTDRPGERVAINRGNIADAYEGLNDDAAPDFISIGCPHCSLNELRKVSELLKGRKVSTELWVTTSREVKKLSDRIGYTKIIEKAGGRIACDTCVAVAPLKGRFRCMATDSAKNCYYTKGSNGFKTRFGELKTCIDAAVSGEWR